MLLSIINNYLIIQLIGDKLLILIRDKTNLPKKQVQN